MMIMRFCDCNSSSSLGAAAIERSTDARRDQGHHRRRVVELPRRHGRGRHAAAGAVARSADTGRAALRLRQPVSRRRAAMAAPAARVDRPAGGDPARGAVLRGLSRTVQFGAGLDHRGAGRAVPGDAAPAHAAAGRRAGKRGPDRAQARGRRPRHGRGGPGLGRRSGAGATGRLARRPRHAGCRRLWRRLQRRRPSSAVPPSASRVHHPCNGRGRSPARPDGRARRHAGSALGARCRRLVGHPLSRRGRRCGRLLAVDLCARAHHADPGRGDGGAQPCRRDRAGRAVAGGGAEPRPARRRRHRAGRHPADRWARGGAGAEAAVPQPERRMQRRGPRANPSLSRPRAPPPPAKRRPRPATGR